MFIGSSTAVQELLGGIKGRVTEDMSVQCAAGGHFFFHSVSEYRYELQHIEVTEQT